MGLVSHEIGTIKSYYVDRQQILASTLSVDLWRQDIPEDVKMECEELLELHYYCNNNGLQPIIDGSTIESVPMTVPITFKIYGVDSVMFHVNNLVASNKNFSWGITYRVKTQVLPPRGVPA